MDNKEIFTVLQHFMIDETIPLKARRVYGNILAELLGKSSKIQWKSAFDEYNQVCKDEGNKTADRWNSLSKEEKVKRLTQG